MARPRKAPDDRRAPFDLWLSPVERAAVEARAAAAGMPTRTYARRAVLGQRIAGAVPVGNIAAWRDLARLAANLNQVAAHANKTGELLTGNLSVHIRMALALLADVRTALLGGSPDDPEDQ